MSLAFAEWGIHSLRWWQEGGTFVGRGNEVDPDIDSYAVLRNFWKALAARYKDEPALFSYNLAVEFYMPNGNWVLRKVVIQNTTAYWRIDGGSLPGTPI